MSTLSSQVANLSPEQLAKLAYELKARKGSKQQEIPKRVPGEPGPLSFAQQRLWFIAQLDPNNPAYNCMEALRMTGKLNIPLLAQVLNEVVRRHEVLRTTFELVNDEPMQIVSAESRLNLRVIDLQGLPASEQERLVTKLSPAQRLRPFDLSRGPLLRVVILRISEHDHAIVLTTHHIISDAWSLGILTREITDLYSAFAEGRPSPLAELPFQYADFALWQRQWLMGPVLEQHLDYWRRHLESAPHVLALPADRQRPEVFTGRGSHESLMLSSEFSHQLKALGRRKGVTLFMTMLAAFEVLLSRYSGQTDFLVGADVANRNHDLTESLIGFFVNQVALRADLDGNPTFSELLERVKEVTLNGYAHQDAPFEKVVDILHPERNLSHAPLFQVKLVLQYVFTENLELPELTVGGGIEEISLSKLDLTLLIFDGDPIRVDIQYSTDLFQSSTIRRMLTQFEQLLASAVSNPEQHISQLELLSSAERQQLLADHSDTQTPFPHARCIHEIFEEQVALSPDAPALTFRGQHVSYVELNNRANQLAHYLRQLEVNAETPVGICLNRSIELVVAMLAILKTGGTYVPLDPEYPTERLAFIVQDLSLPIILTHSAIIRRHSSLVDEAASTRAQPLCLDTESELWSDLSTTDLADNDSSTDNLAYVIYTSGSTGQPKGVAVTHGAVHNLVRDTNYITLDESDVVAQVSNSSFDAVTFEIWGALLSGARLVIIEKDVAIAPHALAAQLEAHGVTVMFLTTALFNHMARELPSAFRGLRHLLFGGEAVDPKWVREVLEKGRPERLLHVYGPTETTTFATWYEVASVDEQAHLVPIGGPLTNVQTYVLDEQLRPVPAGVPGGLYIGGDGLARGYHNQPALTAERFVPHPFSTVGGERLYRTGDYVRYGAEGAIEFVGRVDTQVKIRGHRIEPGEVEAVLGRHASVSDCAVVMRQESDGQKYLVAYVATRANGSNGSSESSFELRAYLRSRLPEFMIPAAIVTLESLPLTANGKVDRRELAAREVYVGGERPYVPPRTTTEEMLCAIWQEVLRAERVSIDDNFFDLGGDSILTIRVITKARAAGLDLSVRQLFQSQTVEELARELECAQESCAPVTETAPFSLISKQDRAALPAGVVDAYPLTAMQAGMLFHSELDPEAGLYHDIFSFHLQIPFDAAALKAALQQTIDLHPVLRTSFNLSDFSEPLQLVHEKFAVPLRIGDLRGLSPAEQEEYLAQWLVEEKRHRFDWRQGPPLRFQIERRSQESIQFSFSFHHAILDGWSLATMLTELFDVYSGRQTDESAVGASFRDFVAAERAIVNSEAAQHYWATQLSESPDSRLPRLGQSAGPSGVACHRIAISPELSFALKELARTAGVPLKSVLLAAHLRALSVLTGSNDVLTGIASHGRPETADGERVLGLFLNTLPFRRRLAGGTWLELVQETFAAERELLPFRRYPMARMQQDLGNDAPLFEVLFNFVHFHVYEKLQHVSGLEVLGFNGVADTNFTLAVDFSLELAGSQISLELNYDAAELSEQIEAISGYYERTLVAMTTNPHERYDLCQLLSEAELRRQLEDWNHRTSSFPHTHCIHQLFAEQVAANPEAVALEFGEQRLTYAQLNDRANQLAGYLVARGAGTESVVGIAMERSPDMIVSLLGVLKTGGAYLPLDPDYPQERLAFMLEDAAVRVVLTHRALCHHLPQTEADVICLDEAWTEITAGSKEDPERSVSGDSLAYITYTSGSTGQPKGVQIPHRGVVRLVKENDFAHLGADEACLQFAPLAFDASTFEIWGMLLNGGRLVIMPPGPSTLTELGQTLRTHRVTVLWLTAGLFNLMVDEQLDALRGLRQLLAGGDALSVSHVERFLREAPGCKLINGYGPTENTTFTCCYSMNTATRFGNSVPIGRPIANTQVYILDENLRPVATGARGELYTGGDGLARGYLNHPELTAERFVPHPFSSQPGARLYRTGDWARYLLNGDIEFLGRVDNQAKVRGFRIEPGEIEAVLRGHQQVREAVVLLKEADGDKHLVAYVASDAQTGELREYLKKRLPDYMVPSFFVHLNEIPLTANGKIDRRALPEPESFFAVAAEYEAPRTPAEELLSSLWASVLRVSRVGIKDNFFDLGGHSLLAIQLNSRIRDAFGVELPLSELFESRTLAELAQAIDDLMRASHELEVPPLRPASDDVLPLSFAQQRLWFLDQLMPESVAYNLAHALRLRGELNHAALEQALNEIVRRHEAVRTTFSGVDGNPIQVITPFRHLALPLVDLSSLPDEEREVQAARIASAEAQRPFDLQSGPLLRVTLLLLGAEDHVLLLSMHHIISDGWSNRILVDEMTALYDTFATGTGSPLPELAIQYGDFAMWQRQWLAGDVLARQLDYWTSKLQGVPDLLALPTDYPRPKVQLTEGAICTYFLNAELTSDLKSLAQQSRATLYMLMLAAFHALLHRYARQATIVTGTPTANRTPVETEPLIGFFVNTLVLRSDFGDDPTFLTHLDRLRKHALEAYTHHDLPFEMLVDELQLERDLSYHPLFQVMFSWEEAALDELTLKGLELGTVGVENHTSQFDLTLRVGEINGRLRCAMQYNTALFEAGTIKRMLGHYEQLLASVVREPQQRISELPLLTGAEKNQLLVEWNDTRAVYDYAASVVQLFEQQVKRTPVAPALVCKDERLSYRVLNSRANQLARYLRRAGIAPESRVGLCVERSLEMVVAMLAVLKAGGAYVPLDPAYPRKRLHFMLEDAGVKVLVTQSQVQDRLKLDAGEVILLDQNWDEIAREADDDLALSVAPDNLAYVIYTSGSSGVPKGVMVQHGSIVNLAAGLQRAVYDELSDGPFRVGLNASLGFDASVQQWVQLLAGNTLVLIPEELRREARELLAYVEEQQIAVLDCTPTQLQMLFEAGFGQQHPPSLRTLLVGGEAISAELWQQLQQDARLRYFNVYGPTECTVDSTVCLLQRESADVTIGRPMTNVQNYILDQQQLPVPVGVVGELYIGGAGVARGYLDQPGLTAERFVPDAFSGEAGARIYRSGDLARYLSDGQIEFLGRADGQIKVRGHRIELGEIEAALRQLPGISNAAAVVTDDKGSGKRIVGYVVADPEVRVDQLLAQLKQRLPDFMLPAVLVALDALPLTGSGKVDRRALAELEVSGDAQLAESYRAPRTIVEEALCGLWQELLQVERVGVNHNFFELGGHSLLATRLMSRVRETFGVELPLRDLFVRPTVAGLAEQVEEALRGGVRVTAPPLVPVSREQLLPLSHAQERLWFLDQLKPGSVTYNVPGAVRLKGRLDVEALRRTLNEVVRRHEVLRTTFVSVIGQPVQVISPASQVELPVHDLSDLPEEQREAEARLLTQAEAAQPFDLSIGPLVRVQLLRFAEEDHVMLFTLHHIISDEWSTGILVREVAALYEAYIEGRESPLPELEIQYADYAVWQREWLQDEVLDQQLEYWRQQLGDELPVLQLPTDKPRPPVLSPQGRTINFIVPAQLTAELKKLSNGEGVTLFMTLLAAFKILLWRYSGQSDVVVGTPIADRNQLAIEGLMGLFVNTLVLRTSLSGNPSFRELLGRVREVTLGAYAHRDLPFEKLVEELQPERDMNRSPLFQVLFTVQNAAAETLQLPGLEASEITADDETAKFDLTLGLVRMEGELHGLLQYNTDLFEATTVERIAGHFQSLLATIAKDPEQKLHELSSVMSAEQRRLLVEWNHTQTDWPAGFVAELFTEQAQRTPENDAVIDGEQRVSYRELNERANQLAHYLQSLGVGPETVVGLLLPRSVEMVVGLLGILKAGGAYLPLDTQLPRGRREFMLKDAGVTVLLTPETFASEQLTQASRTNLASNTTAENLAYVIYTSGSTGQPKGTLITQGGLINYLNWAMQNYPVSEGCGSVLHSSLSFDLTVTSIYPALLMGRSVEIVSQEDGVTGLAEALTRQPNYSLVKLTPAHVELLAAQLPDLTNTTHSLVIGGENLLAGTVERWRDEAPQTRLFNEYGPTETVVGCSVYEIGFETEWNGSIPIGRPIANTQLYILDDEGEVVPLGVKGELYIGGAGVARGYLNRPDLTAERFVPDAYTGVRGARLYRTGDLARYRADGQIEFLGRADNQVKLRGHRIELEEIEAVLRGHDAVREVVVLVTDNGQAGQRIVAYVVRSNTAIGLNDLRAYLHGRLPDYMVPATFVWLDAVPMTTNGKVDRKALSSMEPGTDPTLPRDVLELELTRIWEEVLESGPISPKDNFFELGGHSLLAVQLIDKVERLVGLQIPLSSLFEGATVEQMASMLRQRVGKISEQSLVTIQGEGTRPPLFLVHSASGNVMSYIALARRLGSEQPVYGLQSKGLDPDREPTVRVEDMASEYLEELFNVQPDGPYFLAGWSMGGVIAFEMARQLTAQGKSVAPVLLIDATIQTGRFKTNGWDDYSLLLALAQHHGLYWDDGDHTLDDLRSLSLDEQLALLLEKGAGYNQFPLNMGVPQLRHLFELFKVNSHANLRYRPAKSEQQIILLQAADAPPRHAATVLRRWRKVAEVVEVHRLPGDHYSMLTEPNVTLLAEQINSYLSA